MSSYLAVILFGTAALTYGIRVLPFLLSGTDFLPEKVKTFLTIMPVAALGALIFPGVITSFPDMPAAGIAGVAAAAGAALIFRGSLILPVVASISVSWLFLQFI